MIRLNKLKLYGISTMMKIRIIYQKRVLKNRIAHRALDKNEDSTKRKKGFLIHYVGPISYSNEKRCILPPFPHYRKNLFYVIYRT